MLVEVPVGVAIVPPVDVQRTLSMVPVLVLVNVRQLSWQVVVAVVVNDATGATPEGVPVTIMSSTANDGSEPEMP